MIFHKNCVETGFGFYFQIPASAVEMPGSADVTGLNVQFGALEFGSEPSLPEFGSAPSNENISQVPSNSLYSKPVKYVRVPFLHPYVLSCTKRVACEDKGLLRKGAVWCNCLGKQNIIACKPQSLFSEAGTLKSRKVPFLMAGEIF